MERPNHRNSKTSLVAFVFGLAVLCAALAGAQDKVDAEIERLEINYRDELVEIRKDLGARWIEALTKLKNELTQAERLAEAVIVRDELERVKAMLGAEPQPQPPSTTEAAVRKITLKALTATLSGELEFLQELSVIGRWYGVGASATWDVPEDIVAGTYEMILKYSCGQRGGGTFRLEIGEDQHLTARVSPAAGQRGWRTARSLLIGECVLDQQTGKIRIVSTEHTGDLMNLSSITLVPQGTWAELQSASDAADTDKKPDASSRKREFEKLEGARWIDRDDRKSGEITVTHEGDAYTFSLYFAQLPPREKPSSRYASAGLSRLSRKLGTTEEKIIRLGKEIDTSLRDELRTKDLTIYTRWESRGRAGRKLAYVLVDDEPLALSLIERGHARSTGPYATEAPFLDGENASAMVFIDQLRAAEQVAKQARRGIWGL